MISREVAWRVFAAEFGASDLERKGEGDKAPSYVVTPLGAMVNRILLVGYLDNKQNTGTEEDPYWRAQVNDGTGTFYLYTSKYDPEAAQELAAIEAPAFVAVVGKSRTYAPEGGRVYVSVRPEKIVVVDQDARDRWIVETARSTLKRIEVMEEAAEIGMPSAEELVRKGVGKQLAEGVSMALPHYGAEEIGRYRGIVIEALEPLLPDHAGGYAMPRDAAFSSPDEIDDDEMEEGEEDEDKLAVILDLIVSLDTNKKGAALADLTAEAAKRGIGENELEGINNSLLDKGLIYEPTIGRMKKI